MAPTTSAVVVKADSESPSLLNKDQTFKAATSLLKHITTTTANKAATADKKNLLEDADGSKDIETGSIPIWLNITTKTHIIDAKRLKPSKIPLPHPFTYPPSTEICLITADPQRTFKDIIFPSEDSPIPFPALQGGNVKITKVIGFSKLQARYKQYEAQRQLRDEYDIFLVDDRIITRLPQLLGKSFYKSSVKRPIPVSLAAQKPRENGKRVAAVKGKSSDSPASKARDAKTMHAEIERTLNSALLSLSPSTCTSIRIGYASWSPSQIAENIESVTNQVVTKFVPKKWKGVRAVHIKGPETTALPIWLTDELWADQTMVLEDEPEEMKTIEGGAISGGKSKGKGSRSKKRKAAAAVGGEVEPDAKKQKALPDGDDSALDKEIALRKEKLKKQKEEAAKEVEEDVSAISVSATVSETKKSKGGKTKVSKKKSMDILVGA